MTIFRFKSVAITICLFLMAGCGSSEPTTPPPTLTPEKQAERAQKCMGEIDQWRAKGIWIHGGVEPAVNRENWASATDEDRQAVADIAACILSAGRFEPVEVQIVSEGFKVPITKLHSYNRLFEKDFK